MENGVNHHILFLKFSGLIFGASQKWNIIEMVEYRFLERSGFYDTLV